MKWWWTNENSLYICQAYYPIIYLSPSQLRRFRVYAESKALVPRSCHAGRSWTEGIHNKPRMRANSSMVVQMWYEQCLSKGVFVCKLCVCLYTHTHTHTHARTHARTHTHTHTHTHAHTHARMYAGTHTHTQNNTYIDTVHLFLCFRALHQIMCFHFNSVLYNVVSLSGIL